MIEDVDRPVAKESRGKNTSDIEVLSTGNVMVTRQEYAMITKPKDLKKTRVIRYGISSKGEFTLLDEHEKSLELTGRSS